MTMKFVKPLVTLLLRLALAVAVAAIVLAGACMMMDGDMEEVMTAFFLGPIEDEYAIAEILREMVPLIFTGVAVSLMVRCGQFNMFVEGAFFGGAFVAVGNTKSDEKMSGILFAHIFCSVIGLPVLAFTENNVNLKGVLLVGALGVFQLGIPYILYALASNKCSTISCVVISALEPVFNPVWVAIFVHEIPGTTAIASGLFLLAVITLYSVFDEKFDKKIA